MRLTMYTDYSLRVLIFLASKRPDELSTVQEISDAYGISKNHLTKIVHELGKLELIETIRGRGGGIRLSVDPKDINVGELVRKTEDDFHLVECFDPNKNLCVLSSACRLKGVLYEALQAYFSVLDGYTIADFLHNKEEIHALLFPTSQS
ncbi:MULTISPECIES: RrF2 family transcriptional regulator [Sporosarcina]|uniref:RrF2 family transcriptional regulator n=1 Tax=Sporosarcina TaxID=1569 RepID=UPI00129B6DEE|nr:MULTISPECIES: Rrf2 family transcriptional regulator [Sporosarcina]GKV65431.1 HTH-type transcriptional regulator NsrR [Sporosarcina sp. NCCP-2331]GLB55555.1 HTH-type transcriptional regulator NsrR [Sporosarcina sp. NCCP-2378]